MPDRVPSPPTLGALLARTDLRLSLVSAPDDLADGALAQSVRWVHSSDLADPTPFLSEGLVLLTTGTQFGHDDADVPAYVRRLSDRGVVGLGFGTEVVRDGVPPQLVAACRDAAMPLFEVPYRTPFIAVARANAEAVAADAFARRSWALAAQRAVALAALRPDGLAATLAELSRQLGAWVGLFDGAGALRREHPPGTLAPEAISELEDEVANVLRRGARAGSSLRTGDTPFTLQTLGRGGHLRGVIAIASGDLDAESRSVVTSVIAMAGLALEQNDDVVRARGMLRTSVIHALADGALPLARRLAREVGAPLPAGDAVIAVLAGAGAALDRAGEWLDAAGDDILFGRAGSSLVLVGADDPALYDELSARFGIRVGVSRPAPLSAFADAQREARAALERQTSRVARFGATASAGVLGAVDSDLARLVASAQLAPLVAHDAEHGSELVLTARVWLENDARIDATAAALGVHRHTARARVAAVERVLGTDLSTFAARAELWAALRVAES